MSLFHRKPPPVFLQSDRGLIELPGLLETAHVLSALTHASTPKHVHGGELTPEMDPEMLRYFTGHFLTALAEQEGAHRR